MSETQPLPPEQPVAKERWRDRAWSLRAVIAVALAAVVLGGLAGAALATVGHGDDGRRGPGFGRGFRGPGMPPGRRGFGPGPRWRFNDPYNSGPQQRNQQQQRGPSGPLTPFGRQSTSPATPTPTS